MRSLLYIILAPIMLFDTKTCLVFNELLPWQSLNREMSLCTACRKREKGKIIARAAQKTEIKSRRKEEELTQMTQRRDMDGVWRQYERELRPDWHREKWRDPLFVAVSSKMAETLRPLPFILVLHFGAKTARSIWLVGRFQSCHAHYPPTSRFINH